MSNLRITSQGFESNVFQLKKKSVIIIGQDPSADVVIPHASISALHAELKRESGVWRVRDLGSALGTFVEGSRIDSEVLVPYGKRLAFGSVEACLEPGGFDLFLERFQVFSDNNRWLSMPVSVVIHLLILFFLSRVIITQALKQKPVMSSADVLVEDVMEDSRPKGPEGGGDSDIPELPSMPDSTDQVVTENTIITDTITSPDAMAMPLFVPQAPDLNRRSTLNSRSGTGTVYRSGGLGKGSGLGKGVGDWVGGGSGGIGISGRGKNLKTINEFSAYFVIHSGDWYAALDWKMGADSRQAEISPTGLPDEKYIEWYKRDPIPNTGPFLAYQWGFLNTNGTSQDNRGRVMEFTPGAVSNLLKFVRLASADNIKGSAKPKAVVLDRQLVPYTYNESSKTIDWNPAGREKLREVMRKGLPKSNRFGYRGYFWNPQPQDKTHPDFTVEYLLDVKPMPPFIYFTGNEDFVLNDAEVDTLYQYILRGGAIWGDCGFAGNRSKFDVAFRREIKRVIPDEDKPFKPLRTSGDLFLAGEDAYFDLERLPYGMQFYDSPIEVIEVLPGVVSVVLTKNAYGNFLRFETTLINNKFQVGGELGRGVWVNRMWQYREEFFRGLDEESIYESYQLGANILVYMLGRWSAVLNRPENK